MLSKKDQSVWLGPIETALQKYCENPKHKEHESNLNTTIARQWADMNRQVWEFHEGATPFDFDGAYSKHFDQSKIPDLFDELVRLLEEVVSTRDDDGNYVINRRDATESLETLIATLKKNRKPSHSTLIFIWRAARTLVANVVWEALNEYTVLKVLIPAFQKTMRELDEQVIEVDKKTKEEVKKVVSVELPRLEYHSYALLEYVAEQDNALPNDGQAT
ncbi:hypothetical protein GF356_01385 [candidate division GN15 bacterium]|nr:hypothetical protein [candidate division GN15 bacterium]